MRLRTLAFSLSSLLSAALAHAQAPGELAAQPVVAGPVVVAPPVAPVGDARESVMANRWAVGFSLGSMSLAPESAPDDRTGFAIGELALRFRATPHLELAASIAGGRERTADDHDGDREVNTAVIAARYRFRPEEAWNWFVMAGVGAASVTRHDATQQERSDATQPLGTLGIGLERRFHHLAIEAELRAVGLGTSRDTRTAEPAMVETAGSATTVSSPEAAPQARSGGALSVGLSYYF